MSEEDGTPYFTHDCDKCVFHGSAKIEGELYDFYSCPRDDADYVSIIARYGDEGPEYASMPLSVLSERVLAGDLNMPLPLVECRERYLASVEASVYVHTVRLVTRERQDPKVIDRLIETISEHYLPDFHRLYLEDGPARVEEAKEYGLDDNEEWFPGKEEDDEP